MKAFPEDATDVTFHVDYYDGDRYDNTLDCEDLVEAVHEADRTIDRVGEYLEACVIVRQEGYTDDGNTHHERIVYVRGVPSLKVQRVISEHFTYSRSARV